MGWRSWTSPRSIVTMMATLRPIVVRKGQDYLEVEVCHEAKTRTLKRPVVEGLERSLFRLEKVLGASTQLIDEQGVPISPHVPVLDGWAAAAFLQAGDRQLAILFDPPEVLSIDSPAAPHCGVPSCPRVCFQSCEISQLRFTWERRSASGEWEHLSSLRSYTPSLDDLHSELRVRASPTLAAMPALRPPASSELCTLAEEMLGRTLYLGVVRELPHRPVLHKRLQGLNGGADVGCQAPNESSSQPRPSERLRVMSYNLSACFRPVRLTLPPSARSPSLATACACNCRV